MMGNNRYGHTNNVKIPMLVAGYTVVAVSVGGYHSAFITDQGQLYVMGYNDHDQLGFDGIIKVIIPKLVGDYKVIAVAVGTNHTIFVTIQGQLYVMGRNNSGQLVGYTDDIFTPTEL